MNARSIRRAAERQARNEARQLNRHTELSQAQLMANRANAERSTGPVTEEGKARSSKNALKTALTGRTVLLPTDDADRYQAHLAAYAKQHRPVGELETEIVQSLADAAWRLDRIPGLEEAMYSLGAVELSEEVAALEPHARESALRLKTYLKYERQLRNLHLQEMRLGRMRQKLQVELAQLQQERNERREEELAAAAALFATTAQLGQRFHPRDHGFEFPLEEIEAYTARQEESKRARSAFHVGRHSTAKHA